MNQKINEIDTKRQLVMKTQESNTNQANHRKERQLDAGDRKDASAESRRRSTHHQNRHLHGSKITNRRTQCTPLSASYIINCIWSFLPKKKMYMVC